MLGLFKSKAQIEKLKAIEQVLPTATLTETIKLKLARVQITYSITQTKPFAALIDYTERPTEYSNAGTSKHVEIYANNWGELIDKVVEHFTITERAD